jgi:hypothetical protein
MSTVLTDLQDPIQAFLYALRAPETKRKYPQRLKFFFDSIFPNKSLNDQAGEFLEKANASDQFVYSSFINFVVIQNKRVDKKEITAGTVRNYYKAAKLFCEMNDVIVNWKKISKGLLREKQYGDDRAPSLEEISLLMKYPDRRIRPIILVMASSGIRGGAWDYLKWKHIIPVEREGQILAAKIIVYSGEPDEYYSFITPEAYFALKEWMTFRESYGEKITAESVLMRDMWQTTVKSGGKSSYHPGNVGVVTQPKALKYGGIKSLMERAIRSQGIEKILKQGTSYNTRREWKILHGFRKFFNSVLVNADINHIKKERLMGHDTRLDNNYFKPNEEDLLSEYCKVVDLLTLNEEFKLRQKIEKLEVEKSRIDKLEENFRTLQKRVK